MTSKELMPMQTETPPKGRPSGSKPSLFHILQNSKDGNVALASSLAGDEDMSKVTDELDPYRLTFRDTSVEHSYSEYNTKMSVKRIRYAGIFGFIACLYFIYAESEGLDSYTLARVGLMLVCIMFLPIFRMKNYTKYSMLTFSCDFVLVLIFCVMILGRMADNDREATFMGMLIIAIVYGCVRLQYTHSLITSLSCLLAFIAVSASYLSSADTGRLVISTIAAFFALTANGYYVMLYIKNSFSKSLSLSAEKQNIQQEDAKVSRLARCIVPVAIVGKLKDEMSKMKEGETEGIVLADSYPQASFMFASINSPLIASKNYAAADLVSAISRFINMLDGLCQETGVERIKSIGSYAMIASGVPINFPDHTERLLILGAKILAKVPELQREHPLLVNCYVRVGINTGPCIAGVIGVTRFAFDVWGDSVNVSSRMELHGENGRVHVTKNVYDRCKDTFPFISRGEINVKGKGMMHTFFLDHEGMSTDIPNAIDLKLTTDMGNVSPKQEEEVKKETNQNDNTTDFGKRVKKFSLQFRDPVMEEKFLESYYSSKNDFRVPLTTFAFASLLWLIYDGVLDHDDAERSIFIGTRIGVDFVLALGLLGLSYTPLFTGMQARSAIIFTYIVSGALILFRMSYLEDLVYFDEEKDDYVAYEFDFYNAQFFYFTSFWALFPKMRFIDMLATNITLSIAVLIVYSSHEVGFAISYAPYVITYSCLCAYMSYNLEHYIRLSFSLAMDIQEESKALAREQTKTQQLLLSILPQQIYERLKEYTSTIGEGFDGACVLYADIVGFTVMSGEMDAKSLLSMLNSIFFIFDKLCLKYGLQKLKTLGDCVVVVGGVNHDPHRKETAEEKRKHLENLLRLSLEIHDAAKEVSLTLNREIQFRAGIATGSVIAGVIGKTKFAYDMWGDTVKEANRMESSGVPGRSQVTPEIQDMMSTLFRFEENPRQEEKAGFLIRGEL